MIAGRCRLYWTRRLSHLWQGLNTSFASAATAVQRLGRTPLGFSMCSTTPQVSSTSDGGLDAKVYPSGTPEPHQLQSGRFGGSTLESSPVKKFTSALRFSMAGLSLGPERMQRSASLAT